MYKREKNDISNKYMYIENFDYHTKRIFYRINLLFFYLNIKMNGVQEKWRRK